MNEAIDFFREKVMGASIIIPAFNCGKTIARTLESVDKSIEYCKKRINGFNAEVIVVIDNASDDTYSVTSDFIQKKSVYHIINNKQNLGAGPSRNIGVKNSKEELIFFLDGDDVYFEDHVYLCVSYMMKYPQAFYVQTKVFIDEKIDLHWKKAIESSVPINICVRRWCHDFIGGYFEDDVFKTCTCEDAMYRELLRMFFPGLIIKKETMQHFRYPGNAFDRQMEKFSCPPDKGIDSLSKEEKAVMPEIYNIKSQRVKRINNLLTHWINYLGKYTQA